MKKMYMTFGCGQMLHGYQIEIIGKDEDEIRRAIYYNFGQCYCCLYDKPSIYEKVLCSVNLETCNVPEKFYNSLVGEIK
mgnify:CR=1 FL=1